MYYAGNGIILMHAAAKLKLGFCNLTCAYYISNYKIYSNLFCRESLVAELFQVLKSAFERSSGRTL